MGGSTWNDATDRQLLLVMIHLTAPQLPKWEKVAELMGEGFTPESVRQHFQKIRKETNAKFGAPGSGKAYSPATPQPRKRKANGEATSTNGKRKVVESVGGNDDDEEINTPSKKTCGVKEEDFFS